MIYLTGKDYFPGVRAVLRHVESLGLGKMIGDISGSGSSQILKQNDIDEEDMVIFGAWDQNYSLPLMRLKCKKAILWTSSPGQMEMSPGGVEISMFSHIIKQRKAGKLDGVFVLSKELCDCMKAKGEYPVNYFPAPFDIKMYEKYKTVHFEDKIPDTVGLFIPPNSSIRKNYYNQKLAVEMVQCWKPVKVISNMGGWIEREKDYLDLLSSILVNLQVTHSESFCYQAAEAISLGTISVVSPCIQENLGLDTPFVVNNPDWEELMAERNDRLDTPFVVNNPDSPNKIASWIRDILEMTPGAYKGWVGIQQKFLIKTAEKNNNLLRLLLS